MVWYSVAYVPWRSSTFSVFCLRKEVGDLLCVGTVVEVKFGHSGYSPKPECLDTVLFNHNKIH